MGTSDTKSKLVKSQARLVNAVQVIVRHHPGLQVSVLLSVPGDKSTDISFFSTHELEQATTMMDRILEVAQQRERSQTTVTPEAN